MLGSVVGECAGVIPGEAGYVNLDDVGDDAPAEVGDGAFDDVVAVLGSEYYARGVGADIGSGVAGISDNNALGGISTVLKGDGEGVAGIDEGAGVIPRCTADVNGNGCDRPCLSEADDSGIKLVVRAVECGSGVDCKDLCNVVACVRSLVGLEDEFYVINTVGVNRLLGSVVAERGGSAPLNVGCREESLFDIDGDLVGLNGLFDDALFNGYFTVVNAAVCRVNCDEGSIGGHGYIACGIYLIPLIGVGGGGGAGDDSDGRIYAVVGLVNVGGEGEVVLLIKHGSKHEVTSGHSVDSIALLVNPSDDLHAVDLGHGSKELDIRVLDALGEHTLADDVTVHGELNSVELLHLDVEVELKGDDILIDEGCKERTVLRGEGGERLLNVEVVGVGMYELAVTDVEVHKCGLAEAVGNDLEQTADKILNRIERGLVLSDLILDLRLGEVGDVDILLNEVGAEDTLEVNILDKSDEIVDGEGVIVSLCVVKLVGEGLEDLDLHVVGELVGSQCLENCLVELGRESDVNVKRAVGADAEVDVIRKKSAELTHVLVVAADHRVKREVVAAVLGDEVDVVGELHLLVGHICDLAGLRKGVEELFQLVGGEHGVPVFAVRTEHRNAVDVDLGDVIKEILLIDVGQIRAAKILAVDDIINDLSIHDLVDARLDLIDDILEDLTVARKEQVDVGIKSDRHLVFIVENLQPAVVVEAVHVGLGR